MSINRAIKILNAHNIVYRDYFDLIGVQCLEVEVKEAVERVKTYILHGK